MLYPGSVIAHQLLERLVQAGGGQAADHAGQDGAGVDGGPAGPAGQGNAQGGAQGGNELVVHVLHPLFGHVAHAQAQAHDDRNHVIRQIRNVHG